MSRFTRAALVLLAWVPAYAGMTTAGQYPGIGRTATPAEIAAWDIDVRPDFKGLPPGSGSVAKGQKVWDEKCASCHGTFGESNEVFTPLIGGTTVEDIRTGRVKSLATGGVARTTLMKLSSLATLWDYVNRAMPWNAPKSLTTEEVYAVVAYMLHVGDILPESFVLSDRNMAQVQERLPNRNGMTRKHGMWDVKGKGDVANVACMKNCATEVKLASAIPEYAKGSHGNLAEQQRAALPSPRPSPKGEGEQRVAKGEGETLAKRKGCLACHGADKRIMGPSFREVAARYKGQEGAAAKLLEKLRRGGSGAWGPLPMPPNPDLAESDAAALVQWVLAH
jgi:cytochrome c551/c552/cytochrome c553